MKLLIVGDYGKLARALTTTVSKADWEVYLLQGKTGALEAKPSKIFEQYAFPYDSDGIAEVLSSIQPDAVLWMGLYDASFDWSQLKRAEPAYTAGLINLLAATSALETARFYYLSSQEVFGAAQGAVSEDDMPCPDSERGRLLLHGERMCEEHQRMTGMSSTVIRLDHPYGLLQNRTETRNIMETMCISAYQMGEVTLRSRAQFSALYMADAAEGLYRIIAVPIPAHPIYHLSFEKTIDERWLAEKIRDVSGQKLNIREDYDEDEPRDACLSLRNERARDDFGFYARNSYDSVMTHLCRHTRQNLKSIADPIDADVKACKQQRKAKVRSFLKSAWPFALNLLLFGPVLWVRSLLTEAGMDGVIDMLLLYALLFAGVYGKRQAIFSSLVAGSYRFLTAENLFDMMIDYNTYLWVAEIFIVSMLVGHLRDQQRIVEDESDEELSYLSSKLTEMNAVNEANKRIKRAYEKRLIEYNGSLGRIYKVTSELNSQQPGEVLFSAAGTVAELMDTRDVAIYQVANARYCRLFSATSEKARSLGRSVAYTELPELGEAMAQHRVFINKRLDMALPLMANGIYDGDQLTFIIMIWGLKLENVSLYQANQLTILSYLIMLSVNRANVYLNALAKERFIEGTHIMESAAYEEMLSLYRSAKGRHLVEFCLLRLGSEGMSAQSLDELLGKKTRATDLIGMDAQGVCHILLPNSTPTDAQLVVDRMRESGLGCDIEAVGD